MRSARVAAQPFSLGDGAWGIEVTGVDNGFRLTDISEIINFLGPHTYPVGDDPVRQRYAAVLACELWTVGKPVIMEEFGVSSDFASDAHAATYYRHVLRTATLLAGATGWIAWNNTDFALPGSGDPCRTRLRAGTSGLTDSRGRPNGAKGNEGLRAHARKSSTTPAPGEPTPTPP